MNGFMPEAAEGRAFKTPALSCNHIWMSCGCLELWSLWLQGCWRRPSFIAASLPPSGTAAMRNTKRGSWFIQELNTALRLHARDKHLADILVQVKTKHPILLFLQSEELNFHIFVYPSSLGQPSYKGEGGLCPRHRPSPLQGDV